MTCIVGVVAQGAVLLGADSAGVSGLDSRERRDTKVFSKGGMVFGCTSSFRMTQLLRFHLAVPARPVEQDLHEYAVAALVPAIRDCLKDGGYTRIESNREESGDFLVGIADRLFAIHSDFQVAEHALGYDAFGSGADYAMGAMHALSEASARERAVAGLVAAATFSAGVRDPFHFVWTAPDLAVPASPHVAQEPA